MKHTSRLGLVCWLLGAALGAGMHVSAMAGVVIEGTRVIYPSNEREVTVRVQNDGEMPTLVQTWLDNGNPLERPETTQVPFLVTPPLFRMEPKQGQALRILHTGEPLAQDKETLFWLSVMELPPKRPADSDDNALQMAFRTRVKLFYRPVALNKPEQITKAITGLKWKLATGPDHKTVLEASNPSPYYITVVNVSLKIGERVVTIPDGAMASPGGTATLLSKDLAGISAVAGIKVKYDVINDYGAMVTLDSSVNQ